MVNSVFALMMMVPLLVRLALIVRAPPPAFTLSVPSLVSSPLGTMKLAARIPSRVIVPLLVKPLSAVRVASRLGPPFTSTVCTELLLPNRWQSPRMSKVASEEPPLSCRVESSSTSVGVPIMFPPL